MCSIRPKKVLFLPTVTLEFDTTDSTYRVYFPQKRKDRYVQTENYSLRKQMCCSSPRSCSCSRPSGNTADVFQMFVKQGWGAGVGTPCCPWKGRGPALHRGPFGWAPFGWAPFGWAPFGQTTVQRAGEQRLCRLVDSERAAKRRSSHPLHTYNLQASARKQREGRRLPRKGKAALGAAGPNELLASSLCDQKPKNSS